MLEVSLQLKVDRAIKLLRSTVGEQTVEVSFSGGKDSEVILELVKMAGVKHRVIYKSSTIDPPGTIAHVLSKGAEIIRPGKSFLKLIEQKGMPTRRARFCCDKLKEYKVMDMAVHGIRREESSKRSKRYSEDDPVVCRVYGAKKNHVDVILPILGWTSIDVEQFIAERGIKCHPLYYNENGNFDVTRRLGCVFCPLASDRGLSGYVQYPKFVRQVCKALGVWWNTHPNASSHRKFTDHYALFAHNVFFETYDRFCRESEHFKGVSDWKTFLEAFFDVELD